MKSILFLLLPLIFLTYKVTAQSDLNEMDKLTSTAKVWGFLKYYHPEVAKGKFNWDNELLKILPVVKQAQTKEELSLIFLTWINSLGQVKRCNSCQKNDKMQFFDNNYDLSWMADSDIFTEELTRKLENIEKNRYGRKTSYYARSDKAGNISITNEPEYKNIEYLENEDYRYLSLFKYWNIIEYFFPYKYMTDQKWNDVLIEMIPKFREAKNDEAYHLVIQEVSAKINDSHTSLMRSNGVVKHLGGGDKSAPVRLTVFEDSIFVTGFYNDSLAEKNDFKIGDAIIKVNDESVQEIVKRIEKYIPSSNKNRTKFFTQQLLLRDYKDSVKVSYVREGEKHIKKVRLYSSKEFGFEIPPPLTEKYTILEDNIGYINMSNIKIKEVDKMMDNLINCKAIIFDGRYRPNGIYRRISHHIKPQRSEFVKIIIPDVSYPGRYIWKDTKDLEVGGNNNDYYKGKVILLVDGQTQSHAEYSTMALQTAPNSITIGTQTSGADGNLSSFEFLGGYATSMSGTGIFYPDGTETQRMGIKIDFKVVPTLEGIIQNEDEILKAGIDEAKK